MNKDFKGVLWGANGWKFTPLKECQVKTLLREEMDKSEKEFEAEKMKKDDNYENKLNNTMNIILKEKGFNTEELDKIIEQEIDNNQKIIEGARALSGVIDKILAEKDYGRTMELVKEFIDIHDKQTNAALFGSPEEKEEGYVSSNKLYSSIDLKYDNEIKKIKEQDIIVDDKNNIWMKQEISEESDVDKILFHMGLTKGSEAFEEHKKNIINQMKLCNNKEIKPDKIKSAADAQKNGYVLDFKKDNEILDELDKKWDDNKIVILSDVDANKVKKLFEEKEEDMKIIEQGLLDAAGAILKEAGMEIKNMPKAEELAKMISSIEEDDPIKFGEELAKKIENAHIGSSVESLFEEMGELEEVEGMVKKKIADSLHISEVNAGITLEKLKNGEAAKHLKDMSKSNLEKANDNNLEKLHNIIKQDEELSKFMHGDFDKKKYWKEELTPPDLMHGDLNIDEELREQNEILDLLKYAVEKLMEKNNGAYDDFYKYMSSRVNPKNKGKWADMLHDLQLDINSRDKTTIYESFIKRAWPKTGEKFEDFISKTDVLKQIKQFAKENAKKVQESKKDDSAYENNDPLNVFSPTDGKSMNLNGYYENKENDILTVTESYIDEAGQQKIISSLSFATHDGYQKYMDSVQASSEKAIKQMENENVKKYMESEEGAWLKEGNSHIAVSEINHIFLEIEEWRERADKMKEKLIADGRIKKLNIDPLPDKAPTKAKEEEPSILLPLLLAALGGALSFSSIGNVKKKKEFTSLIKSNINNE